MRPTEPLRDCYPAALHALWDLPRGTARESARLCHGTFDIDGYHVGHAWIELDGRVIDRSNGQTIDLPIADYYASKGVHPESVVRYDNASASRTMTTEGHYGPWHDDPLAIHSWERDSVPRSRA